MEYRYRTDDHLWCKYYILNKSLNAMAPPVSVRYFQRSAVARLIIASLWHALVERMHSVGNDLSPVDIKFPPETDP